MVSESFFCFFFGFWRPNLITGPSFCPFFCLFFCCYTTRKSILRLPPWKGSKTPGSASWWIWPRSSPCGPTKGIPPTRDTLHAGDTVSTCQLRLTLHKLTGWLASLDLRKPYTSRRRILSHRKTFRDPPRLILVNTNILARQSGASSTNTQGIQSERKEKGVAHARFGHGISFLK